MRYNKINYLCSRCQRCMALAVDRKLQNPLLDHHLDGYSYKNFLRSPFFCVSRFQLRSHHTHTVLLSLILCFFSHQKMNILIVHQSIVDTCSSVATLMTALIDVDGTRLSRDSAYDQLVCRIWLTRALLWNSMITSTYGILLTAVERYAAVIYPVWYNVCVAYSYFRRFFLQLRDLFPFLLLRTLCAERM